MLGTLPVQGQVPIKIHANYRFWRYFLRGPLMRDGALCRSRLKRDPGDLGALEKLQFLDLSKTAVTDAGLPHLSRLKELQLVFLNGTKVSRAGGIALQRMIPSVRVVVD